MTYDKCITFTENDRNECLEALKTTYTLSINEACKMLRCSREWIARYIRPNVKHIRLEQSYAQRILKELEHENHKEQIWFDKSDFEQFILSHMNCTRQTVVIPLNWLLKNEYKFTKYDEHFNYNVKLSPYYFTDIGWEVYDHSWKISSPGKRGNVPRIEVQIPEEALNRMCIINDYRNEGESNESIYRRMFQFGSFRLELKIPDKGKKIYYLTPRADSIDVHMKNGILIPYEDYVKYFNGRTS